ncbi:MAG: toll/interleukin-1 receptor domain-containing protein, partial [Caulobacteraceae bacterium]
MAADIFVSFASKDVRVAMTLCGALENRGFTCWISARDIEPGENFQSAIVQALRRAKIMLLVFTANSNTSEEMTKELALASQNKMIVIPLRVEDVTPNDAFAYEFATRQWIDVFADWEVAIEQLSRRIGQALLDRNSGRAGAAADALKTVIASANAAKLTDPAPPEDDGGPTAAEVPPGTAPESNAPPAGDHPVEAAVKALEALEASAGAEAAAAAPTAAFEAAPIAAELGADAERPPASDDELRPAAKKPAGLLIVATLAILVLVGVVVAMALRGGGSKSASAQAPAPASTEAAAVSETPAAASSAAVAASATALAAASDEAQSSLEAPAPKPVKRKKAQPKVDI